MIIWATNSNAIFLLDASLNGNEAFSLFIFFARLPVIEVVRSRSIVLI